MCNVYLGGLIAVHSIQRAQEIQVVVRAERPVPAAHGRQEEEEVEVTRRVVA